HSLACPPLFVSLPLFFLLLSLLIFLMLRRPPRSTLFPYTTLSDLASRRLDDVGRVAGIGDGDGSFRLGLRRHRRRREAGVGRLRSEEHTSELQSRENLVCRLLLEKKKK